MLQVLVIGNIGSDAEVKGAQGSEFTTFRVAHTDRYKDAQGAQHENTIWVDCAMNGKPAVYDYLKRGTLVAVIGNASLRIYSSPKDRCMKAGLQIAVRSVELLGGSRDAVPSRLYDDQGVQHDVQKYFHTDIVQTTLFSQSGSAFLVDENGWVAAIAAQPAQGTQDANSTANDQVY